MLIVFFYTLRSAKLPVSVKEYLTLLEALQANVSNACCSISSFAVVLTWLRCTRLAYQV